MSSWMIASTVKAPFERLRRLADHHLDAGAARIAYYFDDPDDPAADRLEMDARVSIIRCSPGYWRGSRPPVLDDRLIINIRHAYENAGTEWVAHIDADEAFYSRSSIAGELASLNDEVVQLKAPVLERVFGPGEAAPDQAALGGYYRRSARSALQKAALALALGERRGRLKTSGIFGHTEGKCFYRRGLAEPAFGFHSMTDLRPGQSRTSAAISLLHMVIDNPEDLRGKIRRRQEDVAAGWDQKWIKKAGIGKASDEVSPDDDEEIERIFGEAFRLDWRQRAILSAVGVLTPVRVEGDPEKLR